MRYALVLAAVGVCLAGCAPSDKAAMVQACVKDGTTKKTCECMADELAEKVDKDAFHAMALGAQGKDEESQAAMQKLSLEKQFSIATGAMSAAMTCGLS